MKAIRKNAHLHIFHVGVYPFKIFSMYIEAYIDELMLCILFYNKCFFFLIIYIVNII